VQTVRPRRLRLLFALFAVASLVLAGRLAYWQTFGRAELLARATDQVRSDLVVAAHRGVIRDRNGAILATTVELRSLYALPAQIPDKAAAAHALGVLLGRDPGPIRAALDSGAEWLYVQRWLPEETANAIAALHIPGLGFQDEPKRHVAGKSLGSVLVGSSKISTRAPASRTRRISTRCCASFSARTASRSFATFRSVIMATTC